jgi:hypothetical protein
VHERANVFGGIYKTSDSFYGFFGIDVGQHFFIGLSMQIPQYRCQMFLLCRVLDRIFLFSPRCFESLCRVCPISLLYFRKRVY